jgi:hypothetical protein
VRLIDRQLARVGGDVVEDLPERDLDLGLGVGGDLGEEIPGAVKPERINVVFSSAVRLVDGSRSPEALPR